MSAALSVALEPSLGAVAISELRRLSGGASRETWSFDATQDDGSLRQLVLRRDPPTRPGWPGTMGTEARCLRASAQAGLAVPQVLLDSDSPDLFGSAGIVMERIEGETLARRILRDEKLRDARSVLAADCGAFLAGLHAIDPQVVAPLQSADPLKQIRLTLDALDMPSPTFEFAIRWLESNRPQTLSTAIVHGDFRLGNFIVDEEGLRAVLDWELVHLGDPREDLGWLCVKAWRFGAADPVGGFGTRENLLAAYQAAGGAPVSLAELHWWEVFGTLRWGAICMTQTHAHLSGLLRSVELAAIGRRVCETEWDLLLLLEPVVTTEALSKSALPKSAPPKSAPPKSAIQLDQSQPSPNQAPIEGLHGRPTAEELLQAVREFLTEQVMPSTEGNLSFHARVASNVIAMVERELVLGPQQDQQRATSLREFGVGSERELAASIRSGGFSENRVALLELLADGVLSSLLVARPTYLDSPITALPSTDPPSTDPPSTDPPSTDPPSTDPPSQ
ncbi:MAG: phosphotransferase [Actinobacteria bacterium]|nr:phosphotransferase [Actinomycetota bacterium]